jgi:hypothetical protein
MNNNNGALFIGTTYLAVISWAEKMQPLFAIGASCGAMGLAVFGMVNYWKKWKREEKNRLDSE